MEFLNTGFPPILVSLLFLVLILAVCHGVGRRALNGIGWGKTTLFPIERMIFSAAIGLIMMALAVLVLGLAGFLNPWVFRAGLIVLLVFFGRPFPEISFRLKEKQAWFFAAAAVTALFLSFLDCGRPPIGNDALAYHLADPKDFILKGRIYPIPFSRESLWPYQTEMLFTLGLLLEGTTLAQLMHWAFYPLTSLALYAFGSRFLSRRVGFLAAIIFIFTPVVFNESSQAYVDLSLAFFIFLSFYAFCLKDSVGPGLSALFSGILCGAAASTKYLGLSAVAILAAFWIFERPSRIKSILLFGGGVFLVSAVWYGRSYLHLGNPVYPFFSNFFGGRGFEFGVRTGLGMGDGLTGFLFLLWNITFFPNRFGGDWLGPLYLMFAPLALFYFREWKKQMIYLGAFVFLYGLFFFKTAVQARYFLPAIPFLSLIAAFVLARLETAQKFLSRWTAFIIAGVISIHLGMDFYKTRDSWGLLIQKETAAHFLSRKERSFRGYQYLNQAPPPAKIFGAVEPRRFYNGQPNLLVDGEPLRRFLTGQKQSISGFLAREKFDYIWVSSLTEPEIQEFLRRPDYRLGFSYDFEEGGTLFQYRIYQRH
ncbi:MAG: glycosyltransferase family 39 protein [Candidatus Omnitrophica bacterium]|nr:glycosyltransferase family 39 protein [Candidatus Omnitrophota bacterium]